MTRMENFVIVEDCRKDTVKKMNKNIGISCLRAALLPTIGNIAVAVNSFVIKKKTNDSYKNIESIIVENAMTDEKDQKINLNIDKELFKEESC